MNLSNDGSELRNECVVVEDHCEARDLTVRFWESDSAEPQITHVQGCLKQRLGFWKTYYEPHRQYLIVYREWLSPSLSPILTISWLNYIFVHGAVESLLHNCCIARVQVMPHLCSPLSVVAN